MSTCHKETEAIDVERINTSSVSASASSSAAVTSLGTESMDTERSSIGIGVDEGRWRETDGRVKVTVGAIAKPSPIDGKYQQKSGT